MSVAVMNGLKESGIVPGVKLTKEHILDLENYIADYSGVDSNILSNGAEEVNKAPHV